MGIISTLWASAASALALSGLSSYVYEPHPNSGLATRIEANSEQRGPVFLGKKPYAYDAVSTQSVLPESLRVEGEAELLRLTKVLGAENLEFELWPTQDEFAQRTWAMARYKKPDESEWKWLDQKFQDLHSTVFLPEKLNAKNSADYNRIFGDFLEFDDLYAKPVFGNCVWAVKTKGLNELMVLKGWLPTEYREGFGSEMKAIPDEFFCFSIPQPSVVLTGDQRSSISFVAKVSAGTVEWPKEIMWQKTSGEALTQTETPKTLTSQSALFSYKKKYTEWIRILSGEKDAVFPMSGRVERLVRKNNADPENQLGALVEYLEEQYKVLGVQTRKHSFHWRNLTHSNLIAVIPGTNPPEKNQPFILADHIDTAFSEDAFEKTGKRVSAPGADDNISATAALLLAAEQFMKSGKRPQHDIWLVHLTGEEFPADDLGARRLIEEFLQKKQKLSGVVIMDMIGFRKPEDPLFQINAGESKASIELAQLAMAHAKKARARGLEPALRMRFDPKSYLYNTDGAVFSDYGFPVLLLNEHLNAKENISRRHYHETTDQLRYLDLDYALTIAEVAFDTAFAVAFEDVLGCERKMSLK